MYGDFTMMVDAMIGGVLRALDGARMADETIVIFTSDNGPVWYSDDVTRTGHDSVGGLRGMKASNWEGGHRVPFLVRWPGRTKAGSVSAQTISFLDVMATLADPPGQLYNLAEDPAESRNLAADRPDVVARLKAELARIQAGARTRR